MANLNIADAQFGEFPIQWEKSCAQQAKERAIDAEKAGRPVRNDADQPKSAD